MKLNKQNIVIIGSMALLLVSAGILNHRLNNKTTPTGAKASPTAVATKSGDSVTTGSFFVDYVAERETKREQEIKYLDSILADSKVDDATRQQAQKQRLDIVTAMEHELAVENLLKAKGFKDVAAVFQTGSANIVVGMESLTDAQVAQILDIVKTQTGEKTENIKIIPVK